MSATFTRVAFFRKSRRLPRRHFGHPLWQRLSAKLQALLKNDQISARTAANVLWAFVEVFPLVGQHFQGVVSHLASCVQSKAADMKAFDLSNSFWAIANLQESAPGLLQAIPALAENIPRKTADFVPQALSNILWAAAKLQSKAPTALTVVPAIATAIPQRADGMSPQEVSNCLWAAANLQEAEPSVLTIVPAVAEYVQQKVGTSTNSACLIAFGHRHTCSRRPQLS